MVISEVGLWCLHVEIDVTGGELSHRPRRSEPVFTTSKLRSTVNSTKRLPICFRLLKNMSERTALVTGATGLLGRQVVEAFRLGKESWNVKGTGHSRADGVDLLKVDLGNEAEIAKVLDQVKSV